MSLKRNLLYLNCLWLLPIAATINVIFVTAEAQANCPESVPTLEQTQARVQQLWDELQEMKTYPWGAARVYESLKGDRITLSASFDPLLGSQKQEVFNLLQLYNSPHSVYASDGRLLSARYDGCTRFQMLTEKARYSWYYNGGSVSSNVSRETLRNFGRPSWRQVRVAISEAEEKSVRNLFWNKLGYSQANKGMWIAWVPEHGYFEVNIPNGYNVKQLGQFWRVAPRKYRYIVLSADGTPLPNANFNN
jgi:hypothetical protein